MMILIVSYALVRWGDYVLGVWRALVVFARDALSSAIPCRKDRFALSRALYLTIQSELDIHLSKSLSP